MISQKDNVVRGFSDLSKGEMRDMFQEMFKVNECSRQGWKDQRLVLLCALCVHLGTGKGRSKFQTHVRELLTDGMQEWLGWWCFTDLTVGGKD